MHSRIPQAGPHSRAGGLDDMDGLGALLTVELASAVSGARRRAARDGDRQIDTAHLLHSLLENDPEARRACGPDVVRLLGYLVQRSIGYGLRWQGTVEDSGTIPVVRDGGPRPSGEDGPGASGPPRVPGRPGTVAGWSPGAAAAMSDAIRRAAHRGDARTRGADLLAALAEDPRSRAAEVLRHVGLSLGSPVVSSGGRQGYRP